MVFQLLSSHYNHRSLDSMQLVGTVQRAHLEKLLDHLGYSTDTYISAGGPVCLLSVLNIINMS